AAVEGDLRLWAFHAGVDLTVVVAHFGGRGGHVQAAGRQLLGAGRDLQLDDHRVVAREDRGGPGGPQEVAGVQHHARRGVAGDDLLVVGELTLDQPRDDLRFRRLEQYLVLVRRGRDLHRLLVVAENARQLAQ